MPVISPSSSSSRWPGTTHPTPHTQTHAQSRYTAASEDKYDKSPRELGVILNRLVMTEEIEKVDGRYAIRRKG